MAELTVYKNAGTTTIIRPERGGFCDHSEAGNSYGDLIVAAKLALLVERKPSGDAILEDYTTICKRQIKTASDLER